MPLLFLPFDILEKILCCFDARGVLVCGRVCKSLHDVVTTSLPIRYTIALAARGMRDGSNHSASIAERLDMLEKYELAWRELAWKESLRFELPDPCRHVYMDDGFLLMIDQRGHLKAARLPSPLRGVTFEEYKWNVPPGFFERPFTVLMDPHRDLVAFLRATDVPGSITLDARSLSTGELHPLSPPSETIHFQRSVWDPLEEDSNASMCLWGRFLVMKCDVVVSGVRECCPRIYDWSQGGHDVTPIRSNALVDALTFLDDTHALLLVSHRSSSDHQSSELLVADLQIIDAEGRATVTPAFQLPSILWCCGGGLGCMIGLPPVVSKLADDGCYFEDDGWTLSNITTYPDESYTTAEQVALRVSFSALKTFMNGSYTGVTTEIPYSTWKKAVILDHDIPPHSIHSHYMHGSRLFFGDLGASTLGVVDFHPRRLAWMQNSNPRYRETSFGIPPQSLGIGQAIDLRISGDCLVVNEYGLGAGGLDLGPIVSITVYSLM
ncbi:hypothetical protein PENSPDRAFT_757902 [Peniophora sp. CONT]|nr:hypothetical protein PENSPDRAFT_757902 [Peniophora sp. CONT]